MNVHLSVTKFFSLFLLLIFLTCCRETPRYDLAIRDVKIFDSETKQIFENKTILISSDTITSIVDAEEVVIASRIINGNKRLVCPGFIDTHIHLTDMIGNYELAPEIISEDSIEEYRNRLADAYLPYGVTTVRDAGHPEKWMDVSLEWQKNSLPGYPNIFICGAAIISDEERKTFIGHVEVNNPREAAKKVQEYYDKGLRHIKIYWRLREPEMQSVVAKAKELGMNICAHIDFNVVSIQTAMILGVKHFEHAYTPVMSVFNFSKHWNNFRETYQQNFENVSFWTQILEIHRYVNSNPALKAKYSELVENMAFNEATLSSTIHLFASVAGRTAYKTLMQTPEGQEEKFDELTEVQLKRLSEDFDILLSYFKMAHDKGVKLRLGTDCMNGGKAIVSEMLLLSEAGFSVEDILQIATINGANSIDQGDKLGSIKIGKKADLVIFEKDPFDDYKNFLSEKLVIKDGVIFNN